MSRSIISAVLVQVTLLGSLSAFATEGVTEKAVESENLPVVTEAATPVATAASPKESEIALNLDKNNKNSSEGSSAAKAILSAVVIAIMAGAAFVLLKKYSYKAKASKNQPQIKILTQHFMGPKKSLAIVRVAGESILVGITDQNISMIKSLSLLDEDLPQDVPKNFGQLVADGTDEDEDNDLAKGIKDSVVRRLQEMRNL